MLADTRPVDEARLSDAPIKQRIAIARRWIDRLRTDARAVEAQLERWNRYLELLQAVDDAERRLEVAAVNSRVPVTARSAQHWSLTEHIVHFAFHQPDYHVSIKAAVAFTVDQGLVGQCARRTVGGILAHRRDLFRRSSRGAYALTAKGLEVARRLAADVRTEIPMPPARDECWAPLWPVGLPGIPVAAGSGRAN